MSTTQPGLFYHHRSPYVTATGGYRNSPVVHRTKQSFWLLLLNKRYLVNLINSKLIFLWDSAVNHFRLCSSWWSTRSRLHAVLNRSKPTNMPETEYFVRLNYALKKDNVFPAAFLMGAAARARATWLHERPSTEIFCECFHNFDLFRLDTENSPSRKKPLKLFRAAVRVWKGFNHHASGYLGPSTTEKQQYEQNNVHYFK